MSSRYFWKPTGTLLLLQIETNHPENPIVDYHTTTSFPSVKPSKVIWATSSPIGIFSHIDYTESSTVIEPITPATPSAVTVGCVANDDCSYETTCGQ